MRLVGVVDPRVSFAELAAWPDDGRRYELYDGEVIVVPAPFPRHQRVVFRIAEILAEYEHARGGLTFTSPFDVVLSEFDVVQPDIVYFREERRHVIDMQAPTRAAPDLAVEVLSRSTAARDRGRKMALFARYGIGEYWIVDGDAQTIEIRVLVASGYELAVTAGAGERVASPTFADLVVDAARVFAE
jgi:Uma2 family endonuclease